MKGLRGKRATTMRRTRENEKLLVSNPENGRGRVFKLPLTVVFSDFLPFFQVCLQFLEPPLNSLDLPLWVHGFFSCTSRCGRVNLSSSHCINFLKLGRVPFPGLPRTKIEWNSHRSLKQWMWIFPPLLSRQWSLNSDWLQNGKPSKQPYILGNKLRRQIIQTWKCRNDLTLSLVIWARPQMNIRNEDTSSMRIGISDLHSNYLTFCTFRPGSTFILKKLQYFRWTLLAKLVLNWMCK